MAVAALVACAALLPPTSFPRTARAVKHPIRMAATGAAANYDGARIGPPPDLPSLLLHNRIVYLGTGIVPQVTELIVAQLLYLQFESAERAYYMYINSPGTASQDGMSGFDTDAFAIADTMRYVKPEAQTICLGMAYGTAAMLLATGAKGKRAALPNAMVVMSQPRSRAQGQASDLAITAREVLYNRQVLASMLAERTGQTTEKVLADMSRTKYFDANQCREYGLVDTVLESAAVRRSAANPRALPGLGLTRGWCGMLCRICHRCPLSCRSSDQRRCSQARPRRRRYGGRGAETDVIECDVLTTGRPAPSVSHMTHSKARPRAPP